MDASVDVIEANDVEMSQNDHQDNGSNNDSIDGVPLNGKEEEEEEDVEEKESSSEPVGSNHFAGKPIFNTPPPFRGGHVNSLARGGGRGQTWPAHTTGSGPVPASTNGPPPQMELWVETKTEDGKAYYYHALTRETTWNKPESPNVRIMSQSEIEEINKKQQQMQQQQKQPIQQNVPSTEVKPNEQTPKSEVLNESPVIKKPPTVEPLLATTQPPPNMMSQPPPLLQQQPAPITQPPPNLAVVPNVASPITQQPPPSFFPPPGGAMHQPPNFGQMPFGMPPPGYFPGGGAAPNAAPWGMPPWNQQHMHGGPPPPAGLVQDKPAKSLIIKPGVIDPAVIARAAEWSEHRAPDGRPYYYHAARGESVWEKPQALRDMEAARMAAHGATPAPAPTQAAPPVMPPHLLAPNPMMHHMPAAAASMMPPGFDPALAFNAAAAAMSKAAAQTAALEKEKKAAEEKRKKEEEQKKASSAANTPKPVDKSRPISSTPIAGTPWCVVWTGDGRVFFYNPSTRTSVWERPEELLDREDVDKAVNTTPEQLKSATQAKTVEKEKTPEPENPKAVETTEKKSGAVSDTGDAMEEDDEDSEIIKIRDESDSSYEEVPLKKSRLARKTNANEAVVEAEVRAAKERAVVPLETRIKQFKDMLREKDVSAFSTWEKELHKIVFDPRYLLLTSKERKQVFEKYVKDRAEEERKEKRNKMRQKREDFRKLMEEAKLHGKSSFSEFCQRCGKEDRYKAIEKVRERESLFNEYIVEVRRREKEEKIQRKEKIRHDFLEMLSERSDIDRHARWYDIKKKFENDPRYRAVENSGYREEYFIDHLRQLKDDKRRQREQKDREREKEKERERERRADRNRKDKEKDRGRDRDRSRSRDRDRSRSRSRDRDRSERDKDRDSKDKKDRDKDKDKDNKSKNRDKYDKEKNKDKDKEKDKDKDRTDRDKDKDKDKTKEKDKGKEKSKEKEKEKESDKEEKEDRRRKREESEEGEHHEDDEDEEASRHSASEDDEAEQLQKERERQLRVEASLREREKEVQRTMAGVLRDRDKEREHHKRDEAIGHFNALLTDLVRNPDLTWKEVKRQLRKDHRWELIETLDREDRERIFNEHIDSLMKKKREKFREMLSEVSSLELTSTWKDIKKLIKDDPRYLKYNNSDKCEREFRDYIKDKTQHAKSALRELLQECKLINHKTIEVIKENSNHLKEIHNILKNDKRYLVLEHMADERSTIIVNYLEELHKRGPPPPPTASESTRRQK